MSQKAMASVNLIPMRWLFFVMFLLLCLLFEDRAYAKPLTLSESLKYAMEHSPTFAQAKQRQQIADLELSSRRAAFFPKLDLTSTHGIEKSHRSTSSTDPWTSRYQLTLSETLYDNHESITRHTMAKVEREIAELRTSRERNDLAYQVVDQFYDFSKAKQRSDAKEDQLKILRKQFESVSFQYRQGLKMRKDFLRFKANVQTADIQARSAVNELEKARLTLQKTLGAPPTESLDFESRLPPEKLEVPTAPPPLEKTFEYQISKRERDLKPYEVSLAERKYWPELKLSSSAYYGANSYLGGGGRYGGLEDYGANVLLSLNYNLWDWGILRRDVEKARVGLEVAENEFRKSQLTVHNELRSLMLELANLRANSLLTQELLENQENAFKILEREYRDGKSPYVDYIAGLEAKLEAKILFWDTRFDLASSLAKYRYYEGQLYADHFPN